MIYLPYILIQDRKENNKYRPIGRFLFLDLFVGGGGLHGEILTQIYLFNHFVLDDFFGGAVL